jgi:hypothetical protein
MKALSAILISALFSMPAFATVNALTKAWIVVEDFQEEGKFSLEQALVDGCYGLNQGPQLVQLTAPYEVTASMGCGGSEKVKMNINALVCAKVVESVESDNYTGFKKIVLDISACSAKNNARFVTLIRTAVKKNFPQLDENFRPLKKEVELVLIK